MSGSQRHKIPIPQHTYIVPYVADAQSVGEFLSSLETMSKSLVLKVPAVTSRFSAVYQCNSCATDSTDVDLSNTELVFRLSCHTTHSWPAKEVWHIAHQLQYGERQTDKSQEITQNTVTEISSMHGNRYSFKIFQIKYIKLERKSIINNNQPKNI